MEEGEDEDEDGALLGEPESEIRSPNGDTAQQRTEQDRATERGECPDDEASGHEANIRFPISVGAEIFRSGTGLRRSHVFPPIAHLSFTMRPRASDNSGFGLMPFDG
mgnify:FL=1